jgi:parvulin-like peptidyl-prolyl isomerase
MSSDSKSQRERRAKQPAARAKQPPPKGPLRAARRGHHGPLGLDSEQSARLLLFGVTAAVLIAAAAFIAIGYYISVIQPRGRTVLQVDDVKISYSAMKRRVAYEYYTNPSYQNPQSVYIVSTVAYTNLIDELLLVNRAEGELGLTIDQAAIDEQERSKVGVGPDADEATYSERYRSALAASRLHDNEYQRLIRAEVIEAKAREKLREQTPASVPQVKLEVIVNTDLEIARRALERVRAGEDWKLVATELSLEGDAATTGGLKDYNYEGRLPDVYSAFAFSAAIGDISEPLQDPTRQGAYYVVRVVDRSDQPLTDEQKPEFEAQQYSDWLEATRAKLVIVDKWSTDEEAQTSATQPLVEDATEKFLKEQELRLTPLVPVPTQDGAALIATAVAEDTARAGTQVALGTPPATVAPVQTPPAGGATPAPTGTADGQ